MISTAKITLRLTRLNLMANEDGIPTDPRIALTVELQDMSVDVEVEERLNLMPALLALAPTGPQLAASALTPNINLNFSVHISFISDLTHPPPLGAIEDTIRLCAPAGIARVEVVRARIAA